MINVLILLLFICCIVLSIRLIILNKGIHDLKVSFREGRKNEQGEQHVVCEYPNKNLEGLADECNEYIKEFFTEQYQHRKELISIRQEITNFSHDLRTPITSIMGYIEFLQEENISKEGAESLEVIKRRSKELNTLIEQLYDYVRLEHMELKMEKKPLDIFKMLREHLFSFYHEFERKGIELSLQFPEPEEPIYIMVDSNCIERVFTNLTSNTIKYSEGYVIVSLKKRGNQVVITYKSSQGELTDYDIAHMFDRFYMKNKMRGETRSSGLGLTIVKLYVEQMGGTIHAWGENNRLYIQIKFPIVQE